jgi:enoyl-CoA hydratase
MTKEVAWSQLEVPSLQAGIDLENRTQILVSYTRDMTEQATSFLQRRPRTTPTPESSGRNRFSGRHVQLA